MNYKIIILLLTLILIIYLLLPHKKNIILTSKCWINNDLFPEAKYIFDNRDIIKDELLKILDSNKWAQWLSDYKEAPSFTKMSHEEIINRINNSHGKMNESKDGSWRLYGLILNQQELDNASNCPETIKVLKNVNQRILNAGFSLLEPGSSTKPHVDYNNKFYRLHIPILVPKNNKILKNSILDNSCIDKPLAVFQVENEYRAWMENEYFIFDDLCLHNAWNNTDENRIVLLVDLLKE